MSPQPYSHNFSLWIKSWFIFIAFWCNVHYFSTHFYKFSIYLISINSVRISETRYTYVVWIRPLVLLTIQLTLLFSPGSQEMLWRPPANVGPSGVLRTEVAGPRPSPSGPAAGGAEDTLHPDIPCASFRWPASTHGHRSTSWGKPSPCLFDAWFSGVLLECDINSLCMIDSVTWFYVTSLLGFSYRVVSSILCSEIGAFQHRSSSQMVNIKPSH